MAPAPPMLSLPCCYLSTSGTPARCGSHDTIAIAEMALGLAQPSTKWCRWARIHTPAHTWRRSRVVVRAEATPPAAEPTATAASSDPRQPRRLSFCVNTHCQNQGSELIAQFLGGLGVERLEVCGRECLGNCGNGPNALLEVPGSSDRQLERLTSPESAAQALRECSVVDISDADIKASDLRLAAGEAASRGDLEAAEYLFSEGLELKPVLGRHLLLMNRSEIRLVSGDAAGGLADARAAAECAPHDYIFPFILQVEALLQLGRPGEAGEALATAVERVPQFKEDPDYEMLLEAVQSGPAE